MLGTYEKQDDYREHQPSCVKKTQSGKDKNNHPTNVFMFLF